MSDAPSNFIKDIINEDLKNEKHSEIVTRFPPEPNGYLHIGHAKSICLNFGIANQYGGRCHLRFDDTNPEKEDNEYIESIQEDVKWLGFDWDEHMYFASDYFGKLHEYAVNLIKDGKAYVCSLTPEEIREYRGTAKASGKESPYRNRTVEENLDLFERMKNGEFKDGEHLLRAKIDMASPNVLLRDPAIYRIRHFHHHRTGDDWCIYPMYDFAHGISDAIEGVTHSVCTLEFEVHRPLYDWFLDEIPTDNHPQQIEFARLNLSYTILSKRKIIQLVKGNFVNGWDDPRMPTISGMRRRGYTPEAIQDFAERIGVAKRDSMVDIALLEHCLREDLNKKAPRVMAVLDPVKVVIENYPEGKTEELEAINNPEDESMGKRMLTFSREIYIDRNDFREDPPRKYFRLAPGKEVRLKHAYYVTCTDVIKDESGEVTELRCSYDPLTKGGWSDDGRKVKGTLQWVCAENSLDAEVRLYNHLFTKENPLDTEDGKEFTDYISEDSLEVISHAKIESGLKTAKAGERFQFLRHGYFSVDTDSTDDKPVFNRIFSLRDSWAKIEKKQK